MSEFKSASFDMENFYWSWLPGIPKIMKWPVRECRQSQGTEVEVFCKADDCSYFIKRKQLSLFPGEFDRFKQKGIDCLKKKKITLKAFLEDVEWALSMKRKLDSIYHETDDESTNTQVHMMDKDDCVDKLVKEDDKDKMEKEDDKDKMEKEYDNDRIEKEDDNKMENDKMEKEDDQDKMETEDDNKMEKDNMEKEDDKKMENDKKEYDNDRIEKEDDNKMENDKMEKEDDNDKIEKEDDNKMEDDQDMMDKDDDNDKMEKEDDNKMEDDKMEKEDNDRIEKEDDYKMENDKMEKEDDIDKMEKEDDNDKMEKEDDNKIENDIIEKSDNNDKIENDKMEKSDNNDNIENDKMEKSENNDMIENDKMEKEDDGDCTNMIVNGDNEEKKVMAAETDSDMDNSLDLDYIPNSNSSSDDDYSDSSLPRVERTFIEPLKVSVNTYDKEGRKPTKCLDSSFTVGRITHDQNSRGTREKVDENNGNITLPSTDHYKESNQTSKDDESLCQPSTSDKPTRPNPDSFTNITVEAYVKNGSGRNYSKKDYCLFCANEYKSKIAKHYLSVHVTERQVQKILRLPVKSLIRKHYLKKLQNEGNFKHNCKVLQEGKGHLVVSRRPKDPMTIKPSSYLPCENCLVFVRDDAMWSHMNSCYFSKHGDQHSEKNYIRNGRKMIAPFLVREGSSSEYDGIVLLMKETQKNPGVKQICKDDLLIKEFGLSLLDKLGTSEEQRRKDCDNLRTKLRTVARLVQKLNSNTFHNKSLDSFINGPLFTHVVRCVKDMALETSSPNIALVLGHYLKQICLLKSSLGIREQDSTKKEEAQDFLQLYNAHWNAKVSCVANRRKKLSQINKQSIVPKTSDLIKLKDYLVAEITKNKVEEPSYVKWSEVAQQVLVRVVFFNKRRISEVEELKISDFDKRLNGRTDTSNEEILQSLSVAEQALANRMQLIEVRGKSTRGLRKVFILLTPDMVEGIQYLIKTRSSAGIRCDNPYVFATQADACKDGCKAIRDVTSACPGLEEPSTIRSTSVRKYLATSTQIMDMKNEELKMIADHMGHSLAIHTDIYRLQSSVLERTKVARALIAIEQGNLSQFKGKSLELINVNDIPMNEEMTEEAEETEETEEAQDNGGGSRAFRRKAVIFSELLVTDEKDMQSDANEDSDVETDDVVASDNNTTFERNKVYFKPAVKRKRWSLVEEGILSKVFKYNIENKVNAKTEEIKKALQYPELKHRSEAVIRTKINNIILGKDHKFKN